MQEEPSTIHGNHFLQHYWQGLFLTWYYINRLHLVMTQGLFMHLTLSGRLAYFTFYRRCSSWLGDIPVWFLLHSVWLSFIWSFFYVLLWRMAYVYVTFPHVDVWMWYTKVVILYFASQVSYWHIIVVVYWVKHVFIYFTYILFSVSLIIKKNNINVIFLLRYITRHAAGTCWPQLANA
jgi:hypothetical protein